MAFFFWFFSPSLILPFTDLSFSSMCFFLFFQVSLPISSALFTCSSPRYSRHVSSCHYKWCSCTSPPFGFLCTFSLLFYFLSLAGLLAPQLSFSSTRSFNLKSNLFGDFGHICSVVWCQLFLIPLVKPGFMERILARIQKMGL